MTAVPVGAVSLLIALLGGTVPTPSVCLWCWFALATVTAPVALLTRFSDRRAAAGLPPLRSRAVLGGGCAGTLALLVLTIGAAAALETTHG